MTIESNEGLDEFSRAYSSLTTKLQLAESENARLKSELLTLSEQLEDANNEIGRMGMVLKHRAKDMQSNRQFGNLNDLAHLALRHH